EHGSCFTVSLPVLREQAGTGTLRRQVGDRLRFGEMLDMIRARERSALVCAARRRLRTVNAPDHVGFSASLMAASNQAPVDGKSSRTRQYVCGPSGGERSADQNSASLASACTAPPRIRRWATRAV